MNLRTIMESNGQKDVLRYADTRDGKIVADPTAHEHFVEEDHMGARGHLPTTEELKLLRREGVLGRRKRR